MDEELEYLQKEFEKTCSTQAPAVKIVKNSDSVQKGIPEIVIPETLHSTDAVFPQQLLSNTIIERSIESDDEESDCELITCRSFPKSGFPTPAIRKASMTSNEPLQPASVVTRSLSSHEHDESSKLEWTLPVGPSSLNETNQLRFSFDGDIVIKSEAYNAQSGLFHHGDNPSEAGYTISELLSLTKSTFHSQKVLSFQTLSNIKKRLIISGDYCFDHTRSINDSLNSGHVLLAARIGLDSKHKTTVNAAIDLICVYLAIDINPLGLFDDLFLVTGGKRLISLEIESLNVLNGFLEPSKSDDGDNIDNSIESILKTLAIDNVLGLLLTNIVPRLRYLLTESDLYQQTKIIYILSSIALHSPSSSEDILSCEGLVDNIMDGILSTWTLCDSAKLSVQVSAIRMLRIICQSSIEAAKALNEQKVIEKIVGFLGLFVTSKSDSGSSVELSYQILHLVQISFAYGLSGYLLDSHRSVFLDYSKKLLVKLTTTEASINRQIYVKALASFSRMMESAVNRFHTSLACGGVDDAVLATATILLQILMDEKNIQESFASVFSFLLAYSKFALQQHSLPKESSSIIEKLITLTKRVHISLDTRTSLQPNFSSGCIWTLERFNCAVVFLQETTRLDFFSVLSRVASFSFKRQLSTLSEITPFFDGLTEQISQLITIITSSGHWIDFFHQGVTCIMVAFLELCTCQGLKVDKALLLSVSYRLLYRLLPGDDYLIPIILNILLGDGSNSIQQQFISLDTVALSHSIHEHDGSRPPRSFMISANDKASSLLPLSKDWIYNVPVTLYHTRTSFDLPMAILWMQNIQRLEEDASILITELPLEKRIYCLMHIFMLYDSDSKPLFHDYKIQHSLDIVLKCFFKNSTDITLCQEEFATFYEELVEQFISESMGNIPFAKYLLVPITMNNSVNYRISFWSKIGPCLKIFTLKEVDLGQKTLLPYISRLETDKRVIHYFESIRPKITKESHPVLWAITVNHSEV